MCTNVRTNMCVCARSRDGRELKSLWCSSVALMSTSLLFCLLKRPLLTEVHLHRFIFKVLLTARTRFPGHSNYRLFVVMKELPVINSFKKTRQTAADLQ